MLMLRQIEVIRAILVTGTVGSAARLGLRDKGVTSLLVEQNAKQPLQMSDYGLVLEQGQIWIKDTAPRILTDTRIAQLFLGGGLAPAESVA
jgi:branched-chain amino acid transport system ATP-binding protein